MATVKIKFVSHLKKLVNYVLKERQPEDPVSSRDCNAAHAAIEFEGIKQLHNGKGSNNAVHIIQSWNEQESAAHSPSMFNEIGRKLAEEKFPGHAYMVATHTDTGKFHNHIVVCPWHTETGKKIEPKKRHLYQLRDMSDALCKQYGLSVIDSVAKDRAAKTPDKIRQMMKWNGRSYIIDMCQKMDFARAYATNYDEYVGILGEFGVKTRVENKNITYFYTDKPHGKRGSKLGRTYDKPGLEETFKLNDQKFARFPGMRDEIRGLIRSAAKSKASSIDSPERLLTLPGTTYSQGLKDYGKFTKSSRPGRGDFNAPDLDLRNSLIPIEEIRKARRADIFQYCKQHRIELTRQDSGKYVLKGKEFVEIHDHGWVNTQNKTKGSLIEFVAFHKGLTYLQSIADITANKRLLILEKNLGEIKRSYTSFYIPKERQMDDKAARQRGYKLFKDLGLEPKHSDALIKTGQMQVGKDGVIRLFAKDDDSGAFEFSEEENGKWKKTTKGKFQKPLFSVSKNSKDARLYFDPFVFLKNEKAHYLNPVHFDKSVLALTDLDPAQIDPFVIGNRQLKKINVITPNNEKLSKDQLDFFNTLKRRYAEFGIELTQSHEREISRDRGPDISL